MVAAPLPLDSPHPHAHRGDGSSARIARIHLSRLRPRQGPAVALRGDLPGDLGRAVDAHPLPEDGGRVADRPRAAHRSRRSRADGGAQPQDLLHGARRRAARSGAVPAMQGLNARLRGAPCRHRRPRAQGREGRHDDERDRNQRRAGGDEGEHRQRDRGGAGDLAHLQPRGRRACARSRRSRP